MWGPNAVNGVINIITKRAQGTTGLLTSVSTGNELKGAADMRWGAAPSDRLAYRIWGKADYSTPGFSSPGYFMLDNTYPYREPLVNDLDRRASRMGFRFDGQPNEMVRWTVQGDIYKSSGQDPTMYAIVLPEVVDLTQRKSGNGEARYKAALDPILRHRWERNHHAGFCPPQRTTTLSRLSKWPPPT